MGILGGAGGTGVRIATASVRTGFAMTHYKECGEAGRRGRRPLRRRILWCVGEGLCPSRGRPQGSPLRKGCKGCGTKSAGGQRRPPLRKRYMGCGRRADVGSELSAASGRSSEVSEWPRSKFPASAVRQRRNFGHRNRIIGPYGEYKGCNGRATARVAPTKGLHGVRYKIGGRTGASAPTGVQGVQWAGDRKGRPYGRVARGAVQNRRAG